MYTYNIIYCNIINGIGIYRSMCVHVLVIIDVSKTITDPTSDIYVAI